MSTERTKEICQYVKSNPCIIANPLATIRALHLSNRPSKSAFAFKTILLVILAWFGYFFLKS